MIIVLANEGQMCNQLLTLASAYSLGIEYNETVKCPIMNEKLKNDFLFNDDLVSIDTEMYESLLWKAVAKVICIAKKCLHISLKSRYRIERKGKIQLFTDWISMKDDIVFAKHQSEIRRFFSIKPDIEKECQRIINDLRTNSEVLVGVHIRRGDYKTFHNGEWYYSDDQYLRWMESLSKEKKVKYVLFSNEKLNLPYFLQCGFDVSNVSGSPVEDLCCLSKCDYIMGPPSTYSWWAAMYGNRKRLILEDRNEMYSWDDFMYLEERVRAGIDKY